MAQRLDIGVVGCGMAAALYLARDGHMPRRRMVETLAGMAAGPLRNIDMVALLPGLESGTGP